MNLSDQESFYSLSGPSLDDQSFKRISKFAYDVAGLSIAPSKAAMVRTRLARRLRHLGLDSFGAYCDFIQSDNGGQERIELISALTTNVSHFFRENHHFELLTSQVLPGLENQRNRPIRFWSAGCSNGQEPYSLAVSLYESGFLSTNTDLKILASDIDPRVIDFARKGEYPERMIEGLNTEQRERYFSEVPSNNSESHWNAQENLRKLISFRRLNLLDTWPMQGQFDVIFCRNVVIYFDQKTQDTLWGKFSKILRPGGWLFLGHSERISDKFHDQFETLGGTAYRLCKS